MIGAKTSTFPVTDPLDTPYHRAKQEWDRREGDAMTRAHIWRLFAFLCLILLVLALGVIWHLGTLSKIQVEVVEVDQAGNVQYLGQVGQPLEQWTPSQALVFREIREFVTQTHTLPMDEKVVRQNWVTAFTRVHGPARNQLNTWVKEAGHNPFQRMETEAVEANIETVLPLSEDTVQVEWKKTVWSKKGMKLRDEAWRGSFTYALIPATDPDMLKTNPLGFYITHLSWSQVET